MKNEIPPSAPQAVLRGHLIATVPALLLLIADFALSAHWVAQPLLSPPPSFRAYFLRLAIVSAAGLAVGWLWWSIAILRWRHWVRARGADEKKIQRMGTLLMWPKSSLSSKD